MGKNLFTEDYSSLMGQQLRRLPINGYVAAIVYHDDENAIYKGKIFDREIFDGFISDFEKTESLYYNKKCDCFDKMVHVSTFCEIDGTIYMTYYANCVEDKEDPTNLTARLVYCKSSQLDKKTFLDIQSVGDSLDGLRVNNVYDTILAKVDDNTLFVMWTAKVGDKYYRLYRPFYIHEKKLGDIYVNKFRVNGIVNDFSTTGVRNALTENNIPFKNFDYKIPSDIGIMQKFTCRTENGERYYYTGTYCGDFSCIIKSNDFVTWEYVSQPDFVNESKWENATYVLGNKCYYFVRQWDGIGFGFLTAYDLEKNCWSKPVLIEDCQSRSDFIVYKGNLYLFHAPVDRNHIGLIKINTEDISKSEPVFIAHMRSSCFYPFIQYREDGSLAMSYTVDRKHIRLAGFDLNKILNS